MERCRRRCKPFEAEPAWQQAVQNSSAVVAGGVRHDARCLLRRQSKHRLCRPRYVEFRTKNRLPLELCWRARASSPQWAALVAIVDQGRTIRKCETTPVVAARSVFALQYRTVCQRLPRCYTGFHRLSGPDRLRFATGLGSPVANQLIPALVKFTRAPRLPGGLHPSDLQTHPPPQTVAQLTPIVRPAFTAAVPSENSRHRRTGRKPAGGRFRRLRGRGGCQQSHSGGRYCDQRDMAGAGVRHFPRGIR